VDSIDETEEQQMTDHTNQADDPSAGGRDTATGTDPDAKYEQPGFEDKSLGQAVNQDTELAERIAEEEGGDTERAQARFAEESAGSPTLKRQGREAAD
jgi:hypothetical protein